MAKKSGKSSAPAAKRRKAPKGQAAVTDAAAADVPPAAVVEVGKAEGTAAETVGAHTVQHEGAGSDGPGAEAVNETHEARPPAQAAADAPEPAPGSAAAPAEAAGGAAAAEVPARSQGRGKNRAAKTRPADAAAKPGRLSALDAAAKVLAEERRAMGCPEMIAAMAARGYWTSPGGKTPSATLYSALLKETRTKGTQSRFTKTGRGTFGLAARGRGAARPTVATEAPTAGASRRLGVDRPRSPGRVVGERGRTGGASGGEAAGRAGRRRVSSPASGNSPAPRLLRMEWYVPPFSDRY